MTLERVSATGGSVVSRERTSSPTSSPHSIAACSLDTGKALPLSHRFLSAVSRTEKAPNPREAREATAFGNSHIHAKTPREPRLLPVG